MFFPRPEVLEYEGQHFTIANGKLSMRIPFDRYGFYVIFLIRTESSKNHGGTRRKILRCEGWFLTQIFLKQPEHHTQR